MWMERLLAATGLPDASVAGLRDGFVVRAYDKGQCLVRQGDEVAAEYVLLSGLSRVLLRDAEGREVTLGLFCGPAVITPSIARMADGVSLVDIEVLAPARVGVMAADDLMTQMVADADVRDWGNGVMRAELARKVGREWALAALDAAGRLAWFRNLYPEGEAQFAHTHIASFLGMTPVTLSRLRHKVG